MAVVAVPGGTEAVRPLVRALTRHVDVRAADRAPDPDAYLVAGDAALAQVPAGATAAVVDDGHLTVVDDGHLTVDGRVIELGAGATVDTSAWPPITPHVRGRWRERLGLPVDLVVETAELAAEDVPTALALAAAAVVGADELPLALALGCPSVASAETAAAVGAEDGVHVVVGARAEADALARDDVLSARVSRQGQELARRRLDPARTADALLRAWGLAPTGPAARFDERLAELGTAPAGPVRRRLAAALAPFTGPVPFAGPGESYRSDPGGP